MVAQRRNMKDFMIYKCPVCGKALDKTNRTYSCQNRHTYDIAKEGYVNLLLANQMKSKEPGDSKEMMQARSSFLNKGYFEELAEELMKLAANCRAEHNKNFVVFDAGCGEGYYTDKIYKALRELADNTFVFGMDISKEAVKLAAKRNKDIGFCVGSIYHLPIMDHRIDCIMNIFAPLKEEEFIRVLKQGGYMLKATPGPQHLFGLKTKLYDNPYENDEEQLQLNGFQLVETKNLKYDIHLEDAEDIINLLKMTPYYWNTNITKVQQFVEQVSVLDTTLDFIVSVYKRDEK